MIYIGNKVDVALFAVAILEDSRFGCQSITITPVGKSEACFAYTATDTLSADIAENLAPIYSLRVMNT
jgi:hypothetical protein